MNRKLAALSAIVALAFSMACGRVPNGPNDTVWRFLPGHVEELKIQQFRNGRECWIYLPPGYATSDRRYPVLYMHDGRYVFDGGVHANRIAEDLIRRGEIEPIIIVAISVPDAERWRDYSPYPFYMPGTGGGDFYIRAIRDTLKPEVDRRYRTMPDHDNTAISGWSLGGMISAYAAFAYDSTFGKVGAFSPSYGYAFPEIYQLAGNPSLWIERYYHDTGYPDDNDLDRMDEVLVNNDFVPGMNLMSVTVVGAEHTGTAWERRMPDMLRFLFPKPKT